MAESLNHALPLYPLPLPVEESASPLLPAILGRLPHDLHHMIDRLFGSKYAFCGVRLGVVPNDGLGEASEDGSRVIRHCEGGRGFICELPIGLRW